MICRELHIQEKCCLLHSHIIMLLWSEEVLAISACNETYSLPTFRLTILSFHSWMQLLSISKKQYNDSLDPLEYLIVQSVLYSVL